MSIVVVDPVDLYLASTSPRRRALLQAAGIRFLLCEPGIEDQDGEVGEPRELALARAQRKAHGAIVADRSIAVLGVDTVVDVDGCELGKPRDVEAARSMLGTLLGRSHRVHTAHCLVSLADGRSVQEVATSVVSCRQPTDEEFERYLASGEWRGKAGSYGIQDVAQSFLTLSDGAFDTVVGLHVEAVRRLLKAESER